MASSPDHAWSSLLVNDDFPSDEIKSGMDPEIVPLTKGYQLDELNIYRPGSAKQPPCTHCHCQLVSSHPVFPKVSDRTSLMSDTEDQIPHQSPLSCPGKPPTEICLSPLQEPLCVGTSSPQRHDVVTNPELTHQPPHINMCPQPKRETSIEMSTQTERDMSDYPPPIPLPPPPPPPSTVRSDSRASLTSTAVGDVCRICHCESEPGAPLISPCVCCGSLKFVHQACLQQWIKSADTKSCELCKFDFEMTTRIKPFRKWQKLEMTTVERRKIMCSVTFHIIAITCVIWSLYVLIDRTTEEIRMGSLEWPFWTKLIVVAIGFAGGLVFMYVQCKMYVQLCRRWRAYNRVIYIQNCPTKTGQKIPLQAHMLDDNGRPKDITQPSQISVPVIQETDLL